MMKFFRRYVLGGNTDKREGAWLAWLCISGILIFAVFKEASGSAMSATWAFLTFAWPTTTALALGVHVHHFHVESKKDAGG